MEERAATARAPRETRAPLAVALSPRMGRSHYRAGLRGDKAVAGSCASSHGVLEFRSLLGSAGRIPSAVGMRARSGELAAVDDKIFITDRSVLEPAFENLACSRCVPRLRRKGSSGDVGRHAMVRHGPPGMVLRRWLREPHVSGVAAKLAVFESPDDGVAIADLAARGVHEIGAALHLGEELIVEEILRFRVKRRIDRHNVTDLDHVLDIRMPGEIEFILNR